MWALGRTNPILGLTNLRSAVYPFPYLLCVKALVLIQTGCYLISRGFQSCVLQIICDVATNSYVTDCRYGLVLGKSLLPAVVVLFLKARSVGFKLFTQ